MMCGERTAAKPQYLLLEIFVSSAIASAVFMAERAKGDILHCLLLERTEADKIGIWRERHEHRSAEFATMCSIGAMDGRRCSIRRRITSPFSI